MTEQETLNKLHELNLMLADEVKRICEKHNIKYFMIAGTLLGAVRHKGFIPWDDDMDFGMLREDFERFIKIVPKETDAKKFFIQTDRSDDDYVRSFARLELKNTKYVIDYYQNSKVDMCIFIDIFPFDYVPENRLKRTLLFKKYRFYQVALSGKANCGIPDKSLKGKTKMLLKGFLGSMFSMSYLKNAKRKLITKQNKNPTRLVVAADGSYGCEKETISAKWVKNTADYVFEDRVYPGIKDYNAYLSHLYGDYMTPPPKNNRDKHGRMNVDFGEYK